MKSSSSMGMKTLNEMVGLEITDIVQNKKSETTNSWYLILKAKNGGYYTLGLSDHQSKNHDLSIEDFFEDEEKEFKFLNKDKDDLDNAANYLRDELLSSPKSNVTFKSGRMLLDFETVEYFGVEEICKRDTSNYCIAMIGEYSLDRAIATGDLYGSKIVSAEPVCDNYLLKVKYSDDEVVIYQSNYLPYKPGDYNNWENLIYKFYNHNERAVKQKTEVNVQSQSDFIDSSCDSLCDGFTDEEYLENLCDRLNIESITAESLKLVEFNKLVEELTEDDSLVDEYTIIEFEEKNYVIQYIKLN